MRRRGAAAYVLVALVVLAALAACGDDDEVEPPPADFVSDVHALQQLIGADLAGGPLEEADDMVADDRPVAAADLLRAGAIPAARRHLERVREVTAATNQGRAFQRELIEAYEQRLTGIEQYADVLERGTVEDLALIDALEAQRQAAEAILDIDARMALIRPLPEAREKRREVHR